VFNLVHTLFPAYYLPFFFAFHYSVFKDLSFPRAELYL